MVQVYGKPGCVQCTYTLKELEKLNIPYSYVDITANDVAAQQVREMGFSSLPVVVTNECKWSGLKLDNIRKIA